MGKPFERAVSTEAQSIETRTAVSPSIHSETISRVVCVAVQIAPPLPWCRKLGSEEVDARSRAVAGIGRRETSDASWAPVARSRVDGASTLLAGLGYPLLGQSEKVSRVASLTHAPARRLPRPEAGLAEEGSGQCRAKIAFGVHSLPSRERPASFGPPAVRTTPSPRRRSMHREIRARP
jgi:hypothetical protein